MSDSIEALQRCVAEKYGYRLTYLRSHEVEVELESGSAFTGAVHEFEIASGSTWRECFAWYARAEEQGAAVCYAVPKFAGIRDARCAVEWVYGYPPAR